MMTNNAANAIQHRTELLIGLIGGIGVHFDSVATEITALFESLGYCVVLKNFSELITQKSELLDITATTHPFLKSYRKMQLGSHERLTHQDSGYWAKALIYDIFKTRYTSQTDTPTYHDATHKGTIYIIKSLKTQKELKLLDQIYGRNFISISIFESESHRIQHVIEKMQARHTAQSKSPAFLNQIRSLYKETGLKRSPILALTDYKSLTTLKEAISELNKHLFSSRTMNYEDFELNKVLDQLILKKANQKTIFETLADFLVQKDKKENHPAIKDYGQQLDKCFTDTHYIVDATHDIRPQLHRFRDLLLGHPFLEPSLDEYFMFCAQGVAYRSLDLDRQVGAVIVNQEQEILSVGFNDVSKVGGGHYTDADTKMTPYHHINTDYRDYQLPIDYNHQHIEEKTTELMDLFTEHQITEKAPELRAKLRDKLRDITEYKRSTHAEMSALLDAARRGVPIRDATMYVNTYPCHNCTKHLIAAGIRKVVYLHPYPKSKAQDMFPTMIERDIQTSEATDAPKVIFKHFSGLSPKRFMGLFQHDVYSRQVTESNGQLSGKPTKWHAQHANLRYLEKRLPHTYFSREYIIYSEMAKKYQEKTDLIFDTMEAFLGFINECDN